MKKTILLMCITLGLALINTHAQTVTSVENAFIDEGWSFWWNPDGYAAAGQQPFAQMVLTETSEAAVIYSPFTTWPSTDLRVGPMYVGYPTLDGRVGGLTGTGSGDDQGPYPRIPRATIWGFTVAQSGIFEIQNLSFQFQGDSIDGAYLNVFLSSGTLDIYGQGIAAGHSSLNEASINLGYVNAGDIIFVSVAPNGNNYADNYFIDYDIVAVPEPSVAILSLCGILVSLVMIRRRQAARI